MLVRKNTFTYHVKLSFNWPNPLDVCSLSVRCHSPSSFCLVLSVNHFLSSSISDTKIKSTCSNHIYNTCKTMKKGFVDRWCFSDYKSLKISIYITLEDQNCPRENIYVFRAAEIQQFKLLREQNNRVLYMQYRNRK